MRAFFDEYILKFHENNTEFCGITQCVDEIYDEFYWFIHEKCACETFIEFYEITHDNCSEKMFAKIDCFKKIFGWMFVELCNEKRIKIFAETKISDEMSVEFCWTDKFC